MRHTQKAFDKGFSAGLLRYPVFISSYAKGKKMTRQAYSSQENQSSSKKAVFSERQKQLRAFLQKNNFDSLLIPHNDEYFSEYLPPSAERLAFLTGFTGSAGFALLCLDEAFLFTDGRYIEQAKEETFPDLWKIEHIYQVSPEQKWAEKFPQGGKTAYDPALFTGSSLKQFAALPGMTLVPLSENPLDAIWSDRPASGKSSVFLHPLGFAGLSSEVKRQQLAAVLQKNQAEFLVITDPLAVCWLLNIRGRDIPFTPVLLARALADAEGRVSLFTDGEFLPEEAGSFGAEVSIFKAAEFDQALVRLTGRRVMTDPASASLRVTQILEKGSNRLMEQISPLTLLKAKKNPVEQNNARLSHQRDAVALCRFWARAAENISTETEISAAEKLHKFRSAGENFVSESFTTISASGANSAVIHYHPGMKGECPIEKNALYLLDSGGQYYEGTTDITRTVWIGPNPAPDETKRHFTLVLKGLIALSQAVFPEGTKGASLDALARQFLWQYGLDYDHGTGHGVGSFLSVHEGPAAFSKTSFQYALQEGMILSVEPGFYRPGQGGIRLENLVLIQKAEQPGFLKTETLSLVPFDKILILPEMMTDQEILWLNNYHKQILQILAPYLDTETLLWVQKAAEPLEKMSGKIA